MQKRDSSYTLCKGFVEKLIEKHKNIKNINIEIHDTSDDVIKTSINLDNKIRTFDINIKKKKKIIKPGSMNNLKNQKETQNNKNEEILINENKKDSIINIDDKKSDKSDSIEVINNADNDITSNLLFDAKNENIINKKDMDEDISIKKEKDISTSVDILNTEEVFDESEPEDQFDHNDPHFKKYPDEFMCYDCYETNVEKQELFDVAQEYIDKYNLVDDENVILKNENKKLKNDIIDKDKKIDMLINENNEFTKIKELLKTYKKDTEKLIDIKKKLFEIFNEVLAINNDNAENTYKFIKYIDKTLNKGTLRLIFPEKIKFQNSSCDIAKKLNEIQDTIGNDLDMLQDILLKYYDELKIL